MINPVIYPDLEIEIKPIRPIIRPRSITESGIKAVLQQRCPYTFNKDLGDVDIVVTNLTTGDIWSSSASG